jgi:hypothetical protein
LSESCLKNINLFTAAVQPRSNEGKSPRLAYWNTDGVCSKKLEMDQVLNEHGTDIWSLNETHLNSNQALTSASHVCHCMDYLTQEGGMAILA